MSNDNGGSGFLTGLLLGATLGAVAALLFAPKSGKDLRRSLRDEGEKLRDDAEGVVEGLRRKGEEAYQKTRESVLGRSTA